MCCMNEAKARVGLHEVLVAVLSTAEAAVRLLHTLAAAPPQPAPADQRPPCWTMPELRGEVLLSTAQHCYVSCTKFVPKNFAASYSIHSQIHIQYPLTLPRQDEC